jgi:selenide,water dikinase
MVALNRGAARAALDAELHAATDITGFGLAGHAHEMADQSAVGIRIHAEAVPLLPAAREQAETGISFGGLERNRAYFDDGARVKFEGVDDLSHTLLLDPQTSGGLLVGVPRAHLNAWQRAMKTHDVRGTEIGEVIAGSGVTVVR